MLFVYKLYMLVIQGVISLLLNAVKLQAFSQRLQQAFSQNIFSRLISCIYQPIFANLAISNFCILYSPYLQISFTYFVAW